MGGKKRKTSYSETERVEELAAYKIIYDLKDNNLDEITRLGSEICKTPICLISLLDHKNQWFKSVYGATLPSSIPRKHAFCSYTISDAEEVMIVKDARVDRRFQNHPVVQGEYKIRFYAGVPLFTSNGMPIGTLCVYDYVVKELEEWQINALKTLANQIVNMFELNKKNLDLEQTRLELIKRNEELNQFSYLVSHDIKAPLIQIMSFADILKMEYGGKLDVAGNEILDYLNTSTLKLNAMVEGIINFYRGDRETALKKESINIPDLIEGVVKLVDGHQEFEINYPKQHRLLLVSKIALEQIFLNLLTNSIKYNDKELGVIDISLSENASHYLFSVKDNGSGILEADLERIFDVFVNLGKQDRFNNYGSGIGLATVKKLVEKLGGEISVKSELNKGTEFSFSMKKP